MPHDVPLAEMPLEQAPARPDRKDVVAFVTDAETESVVRDGLSDSAPRGIEFHRTNIRGAIDVLQNTATPRVLVVDVTGEPRPLTALEGLSDVVEPDVQVLLIGEFNDVNFYRHATRILGVKEYLFKPITRDMVARHFGPIILNRSRRPETMQGGRVVTITGVRGGVGASTIATNLAWYLGKRANRHTILVDADLYRGNCALLLNTKSGPGLRTALETPQRVDELFVERSAQPVTERLHVLSGEEALTDHIKYEAGAAARLIETLRRRYNFIVVDAPFSGLELSGGWRCLRPRHRRRHVCRRARRSSSCALSVSAKWTQPRWRN
jgi:pilus assembly protein CpaE